MSPVGATHRPAWISKALIARTIRVWQPHYSVTLTEKDAIEIIERVAELAGVLKMERRR